MDADEKEIFRYLKGQPGVFVTTSVICRHAGGKGRFREAHDWAKPALLRMLERGILEMDDTSAYRLKPMPIDLRTAPQWVSPQIAAMLIRSGKKIPGGGHGDDDEAYYDGL